MDSPKDSLQYIRSVLSTPEFTEFYVGLDSKTQAKFDYVINILATIYNVSSKFIKKIENTELYEMRVSVGTNEYRTVIFALNHHNIMESTQIILLNAFLKKSTKDYKKQISKALAILNNLEL